MTSERVGWPGPRALAVGLGIGTILAIANTYLGLTIGFSDSGNVAASLIGFAICAALARRGRHPTSALETNEIQTIASAVGCVPIAIGLSGGIPAMEFSAHALSAGALLALGAVIVALGLILAVVVRARMVETRPLPTGRVTATLIDTLHGGEVSAGARHAKLLGGAAAVSAIVVWLRDARPALLPRLVELPFPGPPGTAGALGFGIAPSPMLLSVGALVGPRLAFSVGCGSAVAWLGLAPWLLESGRVASADYGSVSSWLVWPGVALMCAALATDAIGVMRSAGTLRWRGSRQLVTAVALALALAAAVAIAAYDTPIPVALAMMALTPIGFILAVRAASETDIVPAVTLGTATQAVVSPLGPRAPTDLLVAGTVVAGVGSQGASALWAFKAGALLGAEPRRQTRAMVIGAGVGLAVSLPIYRLLLQAYPLGSAALPAPSGRSWAATAAALRHGGAALPAGSTAVLVAAALVGAVAAVLATTRWKRFALSPIAMAIGFFVPLSMAASLALGGAIVYGLQRLRPQLAAHVPTVASGGIIGEALCGTAIAGLIVAGVLGG